MLCALTTTSTPGFAAEVRVADGLGAADFLEVQACDIDGPVPAEEWITLVGTGYRDFEEDERENARIIHQTFRDAGYSHALAMAAIVNAWTESALNRKAAMRDPFTWTDPDNPERVRHYPNGTGAIGLFQLLPSVSGAGGPSGIPEGYSRNFMGRRYAGNAWQARRHHTVPDGLGRTYYNGTDPRINTLRIVLEVERDGGPVVAAAKRGATIAELADLFGRYIERPQCSTRYRRQVAVDMLGPELALTKFPDRLFAPDPPPGELLAKIVSDKWCAPPPPPPIGESMLTQDEIAPPATAYDSGVNVLSVVGTALSGLGMVVRWG